MRVKKSIFNNRIEINNKIFYYNSLTNAIIELNSKYDEQNMISEMEFCENDNIDINDNLVKSRVM